MDGREGETDAGGREEEKERGKERPACDYMLTNDGVKILL